jgi:hypothetical protein
MLRMPSVWWFHVVVLLSEAEVVSSGRSNESEAATASKILDHPGFCVKVGYFTLLI